MMRLRVFSLMFLFFNQIFCQDTVRLELKIDSPLLPEDQNSVKIYDSKIGLIKEAKIGSIVEIDIYQYPTRLFFYIEGFPVTEFIFKDKQSNKPINIVLNKTNELNEVVLNSERKKVFNLTRLSDFEGTSIYAGKKTEVIQVGQLTANIASNNSRQIYAQISGLNIYQNDDAGLQLNIGGRGLDPNRTSNFNTRQNGYDISADVLGYPESYYSPPAEAVKEIQIVRGAASLQYGTQFGGLVNFKLIEPNPSRGFNFKTRNTYGSNNLFTNFSQISGKIKSFSYLSYFNFKSGDGFRSNSRFNSRNYFSQFKYDFNSKTSIKSEFTFLNYLAQQAGGLSDSMFYEDPYQSNRERNWFGLNWFLYQTVINHSFSETSNIQFQLFGLKAKRKALGFRSNRVNQIDPGEERDLIYGNFNNYGFETRWLSQYSFLGKKVIFLVGNKWYNAKNDSKQGAGNDTIGPDFNFYNTDFPDYPSQSFYLYPNKNLAFFSEHIFYINDNFSITPGVRYEIIDTKSDGNYRKINFDAAGNVIQDLTLFENLNNKRNFFLLGIGVNYKINNGFELYINASENYRSVTFADISIINPAYAINPDIDDEKGFTFDLGIRGNYKKMISYDTSIFALLYKDRIGFVQKAFRDGSVKSERGNVGNAQITGVESLFDFDINEITFKNENIDFNIFFNYSYIESKYLKSEEVGITNKEVEFVPKNNLKTGFKFGYKDFAINFQYSYLSSQFTDSSNAKSGNLSGVIGEIPSYEISDLSISYKLRNLKFESGINNLFDEVYFTRRATGYPGPGIIPSPPRNTYLTVEIKL